MSRIECWIEVVGVEKAECVTGFGELHCGKLDPKVEHV